MSTGGLPYGSTTRHTLADGEPILLRDVAPGDEAVLRALLERVTGDARWFRFFTGGADIAKAAAAEARCDVRHLGVLALSADATTVLGHGMCVPAGGTTGEIAFEVADGQHRRGIGGVLLLHLVGRARSAGYASLLAEVLPQNRDMLDLLGASGLPLQSGLSGGIRHVRIPLSAAAVPATVGA